MSFQLPYFIHPDNPQTEIQTNQDYKTYLKLLPANDENRIIITAIFEKDLMLLPDKFYQDLAKEDSLSNHGFKNIVLRKIDERICQNNIPNSNIYNTLKELFNSLECSFVNEDFRDQKLYEIQSIWRNEIAKDYQILLNNEFSTLEEINSDLLNRFNVTFPIRCMDFVFLQLGDEKVYNEMFSQVETSDWIPNDESLIAWIQNLGYSLVDSPRDGDLVLYGEICEDLSEDFIPLHLGFWNKNKVISKWGKGQVFEHPFENVTLGYGNCVLYFRKPFHLSVSSIFKQHSSFFYEQQLELSETLNRNDNLTERLIKIFNYQIDNRRMICITNSFADRFFRTWQENFLENVSKLKIHEMKISGLIIIDKIINEVENSAKIL